jgi:hypothetical protein
MQRLSAPGVLVLMAIAGAAVGQSQFSGGAPMSREELDRPKAPPDSGLRTLTVAVDQRSNPLRQVAQTMGFGLIPTERQDLFSCSKTISRIHADSNRPVGRTRSTTAHHHGH